MISSAMKRVWHTVFHYPYISDSGRKNLHKYHYEGVDASVCSKILQPFWEACAIRIPRNIAPNLITFIGFVGVLIALSLTIYYFPTNMTDENKTVPSWVYLCIAVLLFYYQTVDAVDGKHARNTNMQSALGELFDHGLDALQITIQGFIMCNVLQLGTTLWTFTSVIVLYFTAYLLIWEDYVTDELRFGELNSPTEGMVIVLFVLITTALFGNQIWNIPNDMLGFIGLNWICLKHMFVILGVFMAVTAGIPSMFNVLQKAKNNKDNKRIQAIGGLRGAIESLYPNLFLAPLWVIYMNASEHLYTTYPKTFFATFGILACYLQTRLILSRVAGERIPNFYFILVPLPFVVINAVFFKVQTALLLHLFFLFVVVSYVHMIYNAIRIMCDELSLSLFKPFVKKIKQ
jgi:ethanolaminephosphotransferase